MRLFYSYPGPWYSRRYFSLTDSVHLLQGRNTNIDLYLDSEWKINNVITYHTQKNCFCMIQELLLYDETLLAVTHHLHKDCFITHSQSDKSSCKNGNKLHYQVFSLGEAPRQVTSEVTGKFQGTWVLIKGTEGDV